MSAPQKKAQNLRVDLQIFLNTIRISTNMKLFSEFL